MPEIKPEDQPNAASVQPKRRSVTLTLPEIKRPNVKPVGRVRSGLLAAAFFLTAVLGGIAGGWLESSQNDANLNSGTIQGQRRIVTSQSQLISQIAKTVGPSVVSVNVSLREDAPEIPPELEGLFGEQAPSEQPRNTCAMPLAPWPVRESAQAWSSGSFLHAMSFRSSNNT